MVIRVRGDCGSIGQNPGDRFSLTTLRSICNWQDRKSTRLNSSHVKISYGVFCLIRRPPCSTLFPYTTLFLSVYAPTEQGAVPLTKILINTEQTIFTELLNGDGNSRQG